MTDIFVSHASEDKEKFVRPLAKRMKSSGINIWYDEFSLKAGDSLRRSIDKGLTNCKGGLIVLSKSFFSKEWPQRELDALFTAEISGRVKLVPIWHEVTAIEVGEYSAFLADRVGIDSREELEVIIQKILEVFPPKNKYSDKQLKELLLGYVNQNDISCSAFGSGCVHRYERMNAIRSEYDEYFSEVVDTLTDEEADELSGEVELALDKYRLELTEKYNFPSDVYLQVFEPSDESFMKSISKAIVLWSSGTLSERESKELVYHLDLDELDERYILFDIPNYSLSSKQYDIVTLAMIAYGCGFEDDYREFRNLCGELE